MREWLESIAGPAYATAMMWTLGALLLLLVILLLIKIVRNLTFGTFVSGGRNRKARLAVMDAAAVDSHRRLVLVRRDDVEHLILIGGQTDIVVEQNIRLAPAGRRPGEEPARDHVTEERPRSAPTVVPHPAAAPRAAQETDAPPAAPARPAEPSQPRITPVARPAEPAPVASPRSAYQPSAAQAQPRQPVTAMPRPSGPAIIAAPPPPPAERPAPPAAAANAPAAPSVDTPPDLDDALRQELEVTLDGNKPRADDDLPESVEDEMSKLLGELSRTKR